MPEHQQFQQSKKVETTFQKQVTHVNKTPISNPFSIIQRAKINPKSLTHADVMQLQRTIGNRAVGRLLSGIGSFSIAQKVPVQRQELPEEEPLQGKIAETVQLQEIPEEKEPLQRKILETIQKQEIPEDEEPLQGKFENKPEKVCRSCFSVPVLQKQEREDEEKPLQGKMPEIIQLQEIPEEEEPLQGKFESLQRQEIPEEEKPLQAKRENNTGMPDRLKAGVESLSGIDMGNVSVHYNSSKPAKVGALAYTQGTDIHVAPGQEKHLPHEAWHVVQQAQGRVKPTVQLKDEIQVNDDEGLEHEADIMGAKAFTSGHDTLFWQGTYEPASHRRQELIDNEPTHVVQQSRENAKLKKTNFPINSIPAVEKNVEQDNLSVQMKRENKTGLLGMTVEAFNNHRKAEQMDWANEKSFSDSERKIIWNIIDWGVSGLSSIKLEDIVKDANSKPITMDYLKAYCGAINGVLNGEPTVPLVAVDNLPEAKKQGEWVGKLNAELGGRLVRATIPRKEFKDLIDDTSVAEKFIQYYRICQPIIQTPTGVEIDSFVELVKKEKADILSYKTPLPEIRNYHKFTKDSLNKLKDDRGKKDKPLTLILCSVYDHNGAFHRAPDIREVIENTKIRVLLIEDMNLGRLQNLKRDGFKDLAQSHGMDGKITQVMIAGHGGSTSMELGGSGTTIIKDQKTGQDQVVPKEPYEKVGVPVYFGNENFKKFWNEFFEALFQNMETKGGFQPRVVLNACLTNSNEVDLEELKKNLKKEGTIDVDDPLIDPKTQENQVKIRKGIKKYIQDNGSLATLLSGKAGARADVKGANASITSTSATFIHKTGTDEGKLDIIASTDSKVAAPKIQYVREGKEPVGAIKAVIETWAFDSAANVVDIDCFKKMEERTKDPPATTSDEFIIRLLYRTILSNYKNNILAANSFVSSANVLHGVTAGGAECRASKLKSDPMIQKHESAFYMALTGFLGSTSLLKNKKAMLVIYQDWMQSEDIKRKDFVDMLGDGVFDRNSARDYLDFTLLDVHIPEIFKLGSASSRGKILLALIGFIEKKHDKCKQHLLSLVVDNKFPTSVINELQGYSEDTLRVNLGLPVDVPDVLPPVSSGVVPEPEKQKNVTGGATTNNYYVEPVQATTKKMTKSTIGDWAKLREAPDSNSQIIEKFYRNKDFTIVGEVKTTKGVATGWYMLRMGSGKVAYMEKKYF